MMCSILNMILFKFKINITSFNENKYIDVYSIKTIQCQHILILIFNNVCSTIFLMLFIQHFIIMTFIQHILIMMFIQHV
jgi:hypothetical protein